MKYDPIQELNREVSRERSSWIRPFKPLMLPFLFFMAVMAVMYLVVLFARDIDLWASSHHVLIGWFLVIGSLVGIVRWGLNKW